MFLEQLELQINDYVEGIFGYLPKEHMFHVFSKDQSDIPGFCSSISLKKVVPVELF